jgi:hypothetical protein
MEESLTHRYAAADGSSVRRLPSLVRRQLRFRESSLQAMGIHGIEQRVRETLDGRSVPPPLTRMRRPDNGGEE